MFACAPMCLAWYLVLLFWFSSSETFVGFLFIVYCLLFSFEQLCGFIAFLTVLFCGFLSDNSIVGEMAARVQNKLTDFYFFLFFIFSCNSFIDSVLVKLKSV